MNEDCVLTAENLDVHYGSFHAVQNVDLAVRRHKITALIGPSGCGKSTVLRSFNRMNDLVSSAHVRGDVRFHGKNIYDADVDPAEVRRRIGMVFQRPNPFPKSIYDNIAWAARITGYRGDMSELVEGTLRSAALWGEVKDKLRENALSLSGGQQQRLCIARALAASYTILIVTHNMHQAARVSAFTAFFSTDESRTGHLVEYGPTEQIFTNPRDARTEAYISGRFG